MRKKGELNIDISENGIGGMAQRMVLTSIIIIINIIIKDPETLSFDWKGRCRGNNWKCSSARFLETISVVEVGNKVVLVVNNKATNTIE